MLSLTLLLLHSFLIHEAFLRPTPHTYLFISPLCSFLYFFITSWQSKRKEDTSSTHPILLDKMELEVYPVLLHAFPMSHVTVCSFFVPFFLYIYHHSSFLPLFFFFFFFLGQPWALFCLSPYEWGGLRCHGHTHGGFLCRGRYYGWGHCHYSCYCIGSSCRGFVSFT